MITVKVVYQGSGEPVKDKKVTIGFDGIGRGLMSEYTDRNGEAHFEADPGEGHVFIGGSTKHKGHLSGRVVVYI